MEKTKGAKKRTPKQGEIAKKIAKLFGAKLKDYQQANNLTTNEMAETLDISLTPFKDMRRGETMPTLLTLQKASEVFGIEFEISIKEGKITFN